ncbi:WD domain, G-beta repeat containing protein [Babesia divergens]|uniref:Cleavage stimulation factor 50 kDa subunit n=1 Tax=Babesia divergens TaxID=32595 RepID=A0AAD9GJS3_BABDI|nr:WD domain, G-beta repeat containing protein [Babesia divergens]
MESEKLLFYEALLQQLHDDGLGEAASLIGQHVKVEPNTMLRKNHLYELFKNTAYLSSRVVGGASSVDPEADFKRREERRLQILNEASSTDTPLDPLLKVLGFSSFCEFPTNKPCRCIAESSDSSLLATGGVEGALQVIPTIEKPNIHTSMRLQGHQDQVDALDFHPRRNIIASGGVSARILIHEINVANGLVQSASEIQCLTDSSPIRCVRFHPCGDFLYAGTGNSIIRLYDVATRACFTSSKTRHQHQGGGINGCDVLKSGGLLFTAGGDGSVLVWDGKNLEVLHALEDIHGGSPVLCVRCDTYGRYITSSGHDGSTKVVDLRMMRELLSLGRPGSNAIRTSSDFMCNSRYLTTFSVVKSGRRISSKIMVFNVDTGHQEADISNLVGRSQITNVTASKHEMALYLLAEEANCRVINVFDPSI